MTAPHTHASAPAHGHGHGHSHGNEHGRDHSHGHDHNHDRSHSHSHNHNHDHSNEKYHAHAHAHAHAHSHDHDHDHDHAHTHPHPHAHDHAHNHDHDHDHAHAHAHAHNQAHSHSHSHSHGPKQKHKQHHSHGHGHGHCNGHGHSHDHDHDHDHDHAHHGHHSGCTHSHTGWRQYAPHAHSLHTRLDADRRALLIALMILTASLTTQLVGSIIASSSLLAVEAIHSAVDGVTVVVSLIATVISRASPTARFSYGYGRAEVLAALMSMSALAVLCIKLGLSALGRVIGAARGHLELHSVNGRIVVFAEGMTLAANCLMAFVLSGNSSINVRALRAHIIADSVENIVVLAAGALMWAVPRAALVDPVMTILVVCLLVGLNAGIAREVVDVLMQAAPDGLVERVRARVSDVAGVASVGRLHLWTVTSGFLVGSVRVGVDEQSAQAPRMGEIRRQVHAELREAGVDEACVELLVPGGEDEGEDGGGGDAVVADDDALQGVVTSASKEAELAALV